MGCGACCNSQVSDSKQSLQRRLIDKLHYFKDNNQITNNNSFLSLEEIKIIENDANTFLQTIRLQQLNKFQAGQSSLLSKQRRIAWKLAIYQPLKSQQIQVFCNHPTTMNQSTKNRFYQISLDIKRTFPSVVQLNKDHLSNVLENITLNFQGVGYTQGMNFYVSFLLLCGFSPQEAYEFFVRLSYNKEFLLIRNFSQNFKNVNCCISIMEDVMRQSKNIDLNQIIIKIQAFGMNLFLFVFSWFLTYFLYNFNLKASILIWDYLFLFPSHINIDHDPDIIIPNPIKKDHSFGNGLVNTINFALKIMQSLSQQLLSCQQISEMMAILRHDSIEEYLNEEKTQQLIFKCRADPMIDWNLFKTKCQEKDKELYKIIQDLQTSESKGGHFLSFMNQCKHAKRSEVIAFQ